MMMAIRIAISTMKIRICPERTDLLVKSPIDRPERQKQTLKALGLNKMNASKEVEATPQILGMVRKVEHMITVEEVA